MVRRNPFRCSLRALLLLTALVCAATSVLTSHGVVFGTYYLWWFAVVVLIAAMVATGRKKYGFTAVWMVVCGVFAWPVVFMSGHPVPLHRFNRVDSGMSQHEVVQLLGRPAGTSVMGSTGVCKTEWTYSTPRAWCVMRVRFDSGNEVCGVVHDH